mgnify:CR=1 FL=1|jgi:hypothetical protein
MEEHAVWPKARDQEVIVKKEDLHGSRGIDEHATTMVDLQVEPMCGACTHKVRGRYLGM